MKYIATELAGVVIVEPTVHGDDRGFFFESFNQATFAQNGIDANFVQTNVSRSRRGVLRGLHYQWPRPQGKLVNVLEGEVYDVAVDIRPDSPTLGQSVAVMLSADNKRHLWIAPGFAHGFCVVSEYATFSYQCTTLYDRAADWAIRWNDKRFAIDWPLSDPDLSSKDRTAPYFQDVPRERLPDYLP
ncbi:dTDP-4-dehydrorhamnose 3,5-epimerase [Luteibacter rhizovicinus]|uniref:dTDP-4-dehydrorhamnose 3,5-epimerase n=1 Tax=Luteibacter rhizovicinus TaxID=242606 RepID=A0A4R3YS10_9GAMM|nr:dTDP-4-dehydrorhamnose 3,5-epimerase [Luteibacter rhizovicinus]TCV95775.1 dTDP-4-dehydrorhamnose 3,5-epimerase [Luteibacter rhizovicinus]